MATNTVCAGEILQTRQRRNFQFTQVEYFKVLEMKTAELFALSCDLGACLSGASPAQRTALREFGMGLGTAYQVYDDCLDLFGSEAAAGKSLGTDLAQGKLTLPVLRFWQHAGPLEKARLEQLIRNWDPRNLAPVQELLSKHDALGESLEIIHACLAQARRALARLPESSKHAGLSGLTDFLAAQTERLGGSG
jgi:octaprenyl-diphosphate synthase